MPISIFKKFPLAYCGYILWSSWVHRLLACIRYLRKSITSAVVIPIGVVYRDYYEGRRSIKLDYLTISLDREVIRDLQSEMPREFETK